MVLRKLSLRRTVDLCGFRVEGLRFRVSGLGFRVHRGMGASK